jgi:quercetin dioxygenase-like cupin family protein
MACHPQPIHNPITGEVLTFLESSSEQVVFDVEFTPQGVAVVSHSHPGSESFEVLDGQLRLRWAAMCMTSAQEKP